MEQLPKIVAQRLQAVSRAEAHPDANLLTAFAEKSLLPREQAQVLEHLSVCTECREVVAHAQPEEVLQKLAVAAAAPVPSHSSSWFSGAVVRWAALAACVVVVGAVVISRTQFTRNEAVAPQNEPAVVAKTQSQPQSAPEVPSEEKETTFGAGKKLSATPGIAAKRDSDQLAELDRQSAANTTVNGVIGETREGESVAGLPPKNSPMPSAETSSLKAAAAPAVAQQEYAKSNKKEFSADKAMKPSVNANEIAQAQAAAPAPPPVEASPILADGKDASVETQTVGSLYKQKDGYVTGGAAGALSSFRITAPMWQLSADGKLIRSLDHGQNWQPVPVGDKAVFHALSVTGREIWVGGSQGSLFYSSDLGQQWQQVKPMSNGQTLTADITAIEFKDSKRGKLTTADHQTWTTNDDGHTWKLETR